MAFILEEYYKAYYAQSGLTRCNERLATYDYIFAEPYTATFIDHYSVSYARSGIARCGDRVATYIDTEGYVTEDTRPFIFRDECRDLLYNLLPTGLAWNRDADSDFYKLISSLAQEICRIEDRFDDLLREVDPFQADELLSDFERMLGLPDDCLDGLSQTVAERRAAVLTAIAFQGGATIDYFESLLLTLGFDVEIIDYTLARAGSARCGDYLYGDARFARCGSARAGDYLYNSGWQYWFSVISQNLFISYARAGAARCGDRLAAFGDTEAFTFARAGAARCGDRLVGFGNVKLECIIRKYKPAHTSVLFSYGNLQAII